MVNDRALGVLAAGSRTGVLTLVSHAHFVRRAIRINHALGSTTYVRIANVLEGARTNGNTVSFSA